MYCHHDTLSFGLTTDSRLFASDVPWTLDGLVHLCAIGQSSGSPWKPERLKQFFGQSSSPASLSISPTSFYHKAEKMKHILTLIDKIDLYHSTSIIEFTYEYRYTEVGIWSPIDIPLPQLSIFNWKWLIHGCRKTLTDNDSTLHQHFQCML